MDIKTTLISIGVVVLCATIARIAPKKKVVAFGKFWGNKLGVVLSVLLLKHLTKRAAENIEEGVISTILAGIDSFLDGFSIALLKDNDIKKKDK